MLCWTQWWGYKTSYPAGVQVNCWEHKDVCANKASLWQGLKGPSMKCCADVGKGESLDLDGLFGEVEFSLHGKGHTGTASSKVPQCWASHWPSGRGSAGGWAGNKLQDSLVQKSLARQLLSTKPGKTPERDCVGSTAMDSMEVLGRNHCLKSSHSSGSPARRCPRWRSRLWDGWVLTVLGFTS